jgi:hypothetical protein
MWLARTNSCSDASVSGTFRIPIWKFQIVSLHCSTTLIFNSLANAAGDISRCPEEAESQRPHHQNDRVILDRSIRAYQWSPLRRRRAGPGWSCIHLLWPRRGGGQALARRRVSGLQVENRSNYCKPWLQKVAVRLGHVRRRYRIGLHTRPRHCLHGGGKYLPKRKWFAPPICPY